MQKKLSCALISITLVILIIGCDSGVQDKPLPMNQNNIEKLTDKLNNELKSITISPSQDGQELTVNAYKTVIEKKMGFSFDKTLRNVILFFPGSSLWQIMNPVIAYVISDRKNALNKGFISQRTFEILDVGSRAKEPLTKEAEEFLGFVTECQNKNNGACNSKILLSVLADHNALPVDKSSPSDISKFKSFDLATLTHKLERKYHTSDMGRNGWITKPDGQEIITSGLIIDDFNFIPNKANIDISKRYAEMLAEEKTSLSQ